MLQAQAANGCTCSDMSSATSAAFTAANVSTCRIVQRRIHYGITHLSQCMHTHALQQDGGPHVDLAAAHVVGPQTY